MKGADDTSCQHAASSSDAASNSNVSTKLQHFRLNISHAALGSGAGAGGQHDQPVVSCSLCKACLTKCICIMLTVQGPALLPLGGIGLQQQCWHTTQRKDATPSTI